MYIGNKHFICTNEVSLNFFAAAPSLCSTVQTVLVVTVYVGPHFLLSAARSYRLVACFIMTNNSLKPYIFHR